MSGGMRRQDPPDPFQQADALLAQGQHEGAARLFQHVLAGTPPQHPRHAEARHRLGVIALTRGQPEAALAAFDRTTRPTCQRSSTRHALFEPEQQIVIWSLAACSSLLRNTSR